MTQPEQLTECKAFKSMSWRYSRDRQNINQVARMPTNQNVNTTLLLLSDIHKMLAARTTLMLYIATEYLVDKTELTKAVKEANPFDQYQETMQEVLDLMSVMEDFSTKIDRLNDRLRELMPG